MNLNISLWVFLPQSAHFSRRYSFTTAFVALFLNAVSMKGMSLISGKFTQIKKKKNKILLLNIIPKYLLSAVSTSLEDTVI